MIQEQEKQTDNNKTNIKEDCLAADSISENEKNGESSWRASDGEGEMKVPTENSTGIAGQSPAQPISENVQK